jgi:hypothetical protein
MELHESLYALAQRLGLEVFGDHDSFRGALDDFLDEESATTGDINLLVDAVRLGAFAAMTSMLDSGASVPAAIEEAGNRLARDRGGADVAGAQWACAMLAFAIGKASDPELRRYRTEQQPTVEEVPPPLPPTELPETSPVPPPESVPQPGADKRKTRTTIVAAAVAVAVVAGGTVAVFASQGDDDKDGGRSTAPTGLPLDLASVRERYSGLAYDVTDDVDECATSDAADGTVEVLDCRFDDGTLTLTTFETSEDLEAHRAANTGTAAGSRLSRTDEGAIYSGGASNVSEVEIASLYWDSTEALQSGTYVAASDSLNVKQLEEQYDEIDGLVAYPTKPEDAGLIDLAGEFVKLKDCERTQTLEEGELEESLCFAPDEIYIYMGVFETDQDFKAYRRARLEQAGDPDRYWSLGDVRQGALATYVADGTAVRYWDRTECQCYLEASLPSGDQDALESWWARPAA